MTDQHYETAPEDRIPLLQKVAFGIGMLGNQMFPAALSIFMVVLIQGLGLNPLLWGILFFVPRMFDAVTDPIMGFITDNTHSRWGRRRPYIFIGAVLAGLSYIAMWQIYPENGQTYNFVYFLLCSIIFYLGMTIFSTPFVALGYEMSNDFHERTRLMAVSQWIGQWAWVIVPWFWIILYNETLFTNATEGARTLSIWVGFACMALAIVPAIFCRTPAVAKESLVELSKEKISENAVNIWKGIIETFGNKPFRKLCFATFFVFNAFNTVAGFSWFIIVYYMNQGDPDAAGTWPAWFGTISALCTCYLVIPAVSKLAQRFGKRKTFLISQSVSLFGYAAFWWAFNPENPYLMFLPLPLFAFGIGGLFTLMMSMTADICDLDELNTGKRREGCYAAVYWWMVKFGFAIAGLLSGLILSAVGFDQNIAVQTEEALTGLRLAYVIVPMSGTLLAMYLMRDYDINEEKAHDIRQQLESRRGKVALED